MTKKIAFLFPGQGSQVIGMGKDFVEEYPEVREVFELLDDICHKPISKLCFEGPMDELTITENLQPAIAAVSLGCLKLLSESGVEPQVSAGHSLGEYAALASAKVLDDEGTLRLVRKRGALMQREADAKPGGMVAVLGMNIDQVRDMVEEASQEEVLAVANHNTAEQIVITGENGALARARDLIKSKGAKAIPLKVSGAWHCTLMKGALNEFRSYMDQITFSPPRTRVLFNATAEEETDVDAIKDLLAKQLISPVRWYEIIRKMLDDGVNVFVEVGPKNVLTGLLKKISSKDNNVESYTVGEIKAMRDFLDKYGA